MDKFMLPNGSALLAGLNITPERFWSGTKVAIPLSVLRILLSAMIAELPFDEKFYLEMYPDLAEAHKAGRLSDLRKHFIEQGYFEGRFGVKPNVDEEFYRKTYADVALAVSKGQLNSGYDHYIRTGATEGRFASGAEMRLLEPWLEVLAKN
ncbi:MAG TPA: hypothetical protein VHE81_20345 [Lacipirellulaceae bacterium]|nr:hypothetical protein [Lacipirellulaceae bacterium]